MSDDLVTWLLWLVSAVLTGAALLIAGTSLLYLGSVALLLS